MKISATILAAGASKRMGNRNKLLLLVDNKPIIYLVCEKVLKSKLVQVAELHIQLRQKLQLI